MKLIHYTENKLEKVKNIDSQVDPDKVALPGKPRGFWVSDDDCDLNWKNWCEDNDFYIERLSLAYNITLSEKSNIIYIHDIDSLFEFSKTYKKNYHNLGLIDFPDWKQVSKLYDGIIITPHLNEAVYNLNPFWYYGWGCASGCIWNSSAIEKVELQNDNIS